MKSLKYLFSLVVLLSITDALSAQQEDNPFANQTFTIDNYIDGKFDNTEDLVFSEEEVEGSICVQYGFAKAKYTVREEAQGLWHFACTMVSAEHGKMVWEGTKKGTQISGKYRWTKTGQDPIDYTFKGKWNAGKTDEE